MQIKDFEMFIKELVKEKDTTVTHYKILKETNKKRWAIVGSLMDWDNTGKYEHYAKIAYQPTNSLMQEYDIDWIMPYDEKGNVEDTEIQITDIKSCAIWFNGIWNEVEKKYV